MEVQIPSPSVFLEKSPVVTSASTAPPLRRPPPAKAKTTPPHHPPTKSPPKANGPVHDAAVAKPKQSKSRNGCTTCKKKRLKCDETKPSCVQCQKRSVVCEGYKKDFKWRTFEETTFSSKPSARRKAFRSPSFTIGQTDPRPVAIEGGGRLGRRNEADDPTRPPQTWSPGLHSAFESAVHAFQGRPLAGTAEPNRPSYSKKPPSPTLDSGSPEPLFMPAFDADAISPALIFEPTVDPYHLLKEARGSSADSGSAPSFSSSSPQLSNLLLPGTDLNQPPDPSELRPPMSPLPYQPDPFDPTVAMDEDFDEEIIRSDGMNTAPMLAMPMPTASSLLDPTASPAWRSFRAPSPAPSDASSSSSKSSDMTILAQPSLDVSSPEMLMLRFDKQTCGILSVKDGPTENPWRTLIWPLARESPALYHAISSMTAFHGALEIPNLHVPGMAHMTKSIKRLASEIENMRLDSALATSLALAFSEGWDSYVSTGVQHLRGAKVMVNNAIVKHRQSMQLGQLTTQDANRLKFLCNTFVYMDVIARLTALEEAPELNFEEILETVNAPFGDQVEVDPLMGCATSLFPLLGRVANLIQRVRKTDANSLTLVSTAMELKEQLQQWQVPNARAFERPEDPNSEVQHSIQTAEAYRYAALLYLHQAVPEIPSDPAQTLAKKVLVTLASVPLSSRATIAHIFPLFAASCEVTDLDDRNWVVQRWLAMMSRLKIGNVRSCWNVVQEVWNRRDAFEMAKADQLQRRYTSRGLPGGSLVPPLMDLPSGLKRKTRPMDAMGDPEEPFILDGDLSQEPRHLLGAALEPGGLDMTLDRDPTAAGRPCKRRMTLDPMNGSGSRFDGGPGQPEVGRGYSSSMPRLGPAHQRRGTGDIASPDQLEYDYTVRGRLHWLGVMADWQWEVFLG